MRAVVFEEIGRVRVQDVPDPVLEAPGDAIVRIRRSAICGSVRLHWTCSTMPNPM